MAVNLMEILPQYFRSIIEFREIMSIDSNVMEELDKNTNQVNLNFFIQTCDTATIKVYENLFGITYKPGETLEYRRLRILQLYNVIAPFSEGFLRNQLTEMFGDDYTMDVDSVGCSLKVIISSSRYGAVDLFYNLILDIVPAHLEVIANHEVKNTISSNLYLGGITSNTYMQTI